MKDEPNLVPVNFDHIPEPKAIYPKDSTFRARIYQHRYDKMAVAMYVVKTFLCKGCSVFIGDGSSTFYVGLEIFYQVNNGVKIRTNNLALAHEYVLSDRSSTLSLAGGEVNADLAMVCGETAESFARVAASRVQWVILSVSALFADHGPTGVEDDSLKIKMAALSEKDAKCILIMDCEKLSKRFTKNLFCVFASKAKWDEAMPNIHIVSTFRADVDYGRQILSSPPANPKTEREHYLVNRKGIAAAFGERFTEVTFDRPT